MTVQEAKQLLGLSDNATLGLLLDWDRARQLAKLKIIQARRAGDDHGASVVSEAQATLKTYRSARYCECGERKSRNAVHCRICGIEARRRKRLLDSNLPVEVKPVEPIHHWQFRRPIGRLERRVALYKFVVVLCELNLWKWKAKPAAVRLGISVPTLYRILSDGCALWGEQ